jgi:hypothetical protein
MWCKLVLLHVAVPPQLILARHTFDLRWPAAETFGYGATNNLVLLDLAGAMPR